MSAVEVPVYYRIELEDAADADTTQVTDAGMVERLAAQTRTDDVTPPPAKAAVPPPMPLGSEASAYADRVRYALMFRLGFGAAEVEAVIDYARSLMPRGGRR